MHASHPSISAESDVFRQISNTTVYTFKMASHVYGDEVVLFYTGRPEPLSAIPNANRIVSPKMIYSAHKICNDRRRAGGVFQASTAPEPT